MAKIEIKEGKYECVVAKEGDAQITLKSNEVTMGRVNLKKEGYLVFVPLFEIVVHCAT